MDKWWVHKDVKKREKQNRTWFNHLQVQKIKLCKRSPGQSSKRPFAVRGERLVPPFSPTILDMQFRMG